MLKRTQSLLAKGLFGSLTLFAVAAIPASSASAALIYSDNFDAYADNDALATNWPLAQGTTTDSYLATDSTNPLNKFVQQAVTVGRRDHAITAFVPTTTTPLTVKFTFIDQTGTASGVRQYNQVLANNGAGALSQLIAMGEYNAATNQDNTKYQARVAFNSVNWFNLNTARSAGVHDFTEEIFSDHVNFYVDGLLDTTQTFTSDISGGFNSLRIGSGLSSAGGGAGFDNFVVSSDAVPEPAALGFVALGGLTLLRRRRA
jgi:MYXO-CTERM domain-containing protein